MSVYHYRSQTRYSQRQQGSHKLDTMQGRGDVHVSSNQAPYNAEGEDVKCLDPKAVYMASSSIGLGAQVERHLCASQNWLAQVRLWLGGREGGNGSGWD